VNEGSLPHRHWFPLTRPSDPAAASSALTEPPPPSSQTSAAKLDAYKPSAALDRVAHSPRALAFNTIVPHRRRRAHALAHPLPHPCGYRSTVPLPPNRSRARPPDSAIAPIPGRLRARHNVGLRPRGGSLAAVRLGIPLAAVRDGARGLKLASFLRHLAPRRRSAVGVSSRSAGLRTTTGSSAQTTSAPPWSRTGSHARSPGASRAWCGPTTRPRHRRHRRSSSGARLRKLTESIATYALR
jgi:hypothetical protein